MDDYFHKSKTQTNIKICKVTLNSISTRRLKKNTLTYPLTGCFIWTSISRLTFRDTLLLNYAFLS